MLRTCEYPSGLCPRPHSACGKPAVSVHTVRRGVQRAACVEHDHQLYLDWRAYVDTLLSGDSVYEVPADDWWLKNTSPVCRGPNCPTHRGFGGCDRPVAYRAAVTVEDDNGDLHTFTAWSCRAHVQTIRKLGTGRFARRTKCKP